MDLTYILYTEHSIQKQKNTHSPRVHMEHSVFQEGSYIRHKTNLNKLKTIEIISNISNNNGMRLENQLQEETGKFINMWRRDMLLNNQWVKEEIKR